ncbi:beta-lactamase/transpeptidase-like protein [Polyplosphaeria fusca]|uniref:Beta-lactamase/transpeptidase-like protein n=1 Tax=Polyplosphaeria fusca TaxID=682080 RepID=A0A9P4UXB2_9PLEO|nr:beta-lactamase/transpeptidase-like protein [Polyplosphaeria fusca]
MTLSADTIKKLRQTVEDACRSPTEDIPGVAIVVVDRNGKEIFAHAAGKRGSQVSEPMTLDNVFWIASCTKMIVGIACMQLVEKGMLSLDDGDQLEKLCPELKDIQVLQDDRKLVDKKRKITLRMLLSHTAGFGYTFFNTKLRDFSHPIGIDEFSGSIKDMMQPLVHQPGESWEYGINIDWAGIALERVTGLSLNDYLHKNIFSPLNLKNISMFPTADMKLRLAHMNHRNPDGTLIPRDHLLRAPLIATPSEIPNIHNSGGAGCFSTPSDYAQIIATLLNGGTSPTTSAPLLQPTTIDTLFTNQIPSFPNFARTGIPASKPSLTNPIPEIYPVPGDVEQGWGLSFMLSNGGATGRSRGTGFWAGLPNCWWWVDRESGVGGVVCAQVLPFADGRVLGLWGEVEGGVYKGLGE